jgi:phosphopantothenate--cysteine ligase
MRVLITGGPTNEYIDEVMKITNMSSGKVAIELAELFTKNDYETTLLLTKNIKNPILDKLVNQDNFSIVRFETTDELFSAIKKEAESKRYDIVIHSSAVADYKPEYSFKLEDMAEEIASNIVSSVVYHEGDSSLEGREKIREMVLSTLTNPCCKVNDDTKISSTEPNLTVKLGLTPKIISHLRDLFPNAYICGFKLLENVSETQLIDAAMQQIKKCNTNMVFANDLAELRKGNADRLVITPTGYSDIKVDGAIGIFNLIKIAVKDFS